MKIALVAGSFDPITMGHLHVIKTAQELADKVYVVVADNPDKKHLLTLEERRSLVWQSIDWAMDGEFGSIEINILPPKTLLLSMFKHLCEENKLFIVRGMRDTTDFEYENKLNLVQTKIDASIKTVYVLTPREYTEVSSSLIRSSVGFPEMNEIIRGYVPEPVRIYMRNKLCK